jgi:hypothetical protein
LPNFCRASDLSGQVLQIPADHQVYQVISPADLSPGHRQVACP